MRLNRVCRYTEPCGIVRPEDPSEEILSISLPVPDLMQLTPSNLSHTIRTQVFIVIGDDRRIHEAATAYFRTIHSWFPIVAERSFLERLPNIRSIVGPGFSLLVLCIFLLGAIPVDGKIPARMRSLYTLVKGFVASLDAVGINSLDLLQCRLLLTIFEVGHGLYPAAYISMGANVRAAVALGINVTSTSQLQGYFKSPERAEEARYTWYGIVITDRYVSLESNKGPSIPKDLMPGSVGGNRDCEPHEPSTPNYQFVKLAQASRLLEQVLAHVHDPLPHQGFNYDEAIQILTTLKSFRATIQDDSTVPCKLWCSAWAICLSTTMTILEFGYQIKNSQIESCVTGSFALLHETVEEFVVTCDAVTIQHPTGIIDSLPVFVVHSIYKAGQMLLGDLRDSPRFDSTNAVSALEKVLKYTSMRWLAGKRYLEDLDKRMVA
ncbi:hypothetical protein BBP40_007552 [Aspergillus hancockii]|nr:hypothetical protein BBP40_007552 [Aspergillus hancockii]